MKNCMELLDQAIDLAQEEQTHLQAGELDLLQQKARIRSGLISQAVDIRDTLDLEVFKAKLEQLYSLQGRLTKDARVLRDSLKTELTRVKAEGARMSGYGKASKYVPLLRSRFSKRG